MPVQEIRIDEATWSKGSGPRKREWRALIADLGPSALWPDVIVETMVVRLDEGALEVRLRLAAGEPTTMACARQELDSLLIEYATVIARLHEEGLPAPRAEALDMAKRVVHDDAARKIAKLFPGLTRDHEIRRRFFSLVVSLAVDTSGSSLAHRHR